MTTLTIASNLRLVTLADGSAWVESAYDYAYWCTYLSKFTSVQIAARSRRVEQRPDSWLRVDGEGVSLLELPYYVGPLGFLRTRKATKHILARGIDPGSAVKLKLPGQTAWLVYTTLEQGRPYGVEVIGDPADVFARGGVRHPLRWYFRWKMARDLREIVSGASAVSYVSTAILPQRYPAAPEAFVTSYSSGMLTREAIADAPRNFTGPLTSPRLVLVGSFEQMYKAPDVVLRATRLLRQRGLSPHVSFIGEGKFRPAMERLAAELEVSDTVTFVGQLAGPDAIIPYLDAADLFILPSRTEGLPRAVIEAMARGMPCIGSTVGGFPELLDSEDLVPPGSPEALADLLLTCCSNPERLNAMAARNHKRSFRYENSELKRLRHRLYDEIISATEKWRYRRDHGPDRVAQSGAEV
jgi:glycosyltransferase involved in cell wall biosynthesis